MKKAQMEILGLAIVVLLLSFGMLLVFQFVVLKTPTESIQKSYTQSQQANNILSAILKTSSGCKKTDLEELLEDLATNEYIICGSITSEKYARNALTTIFANTMDEWKRKYTFTIYFDPENPIFKVNNTPECTGEIETAEIPTPTGDGRTMFVHFEICNQVRSINIV
tara:strand:+ start:783 stop:1283 length:501 start_codon:yes stop_codon:yes gene_type:complete